MKPEQLLDHARELLTRQSATTTGLWPRAAALLTRQALEQSLAGFWQAKGINLAGCSTRAQLICLRSYHPDEGTARRAYQAWGALSRACHHHHYELAPTAAELEGWIAAVTRLQDGIADLP